MVNAAMALEGIRVLDFTQMMMGPWATQFLGDMGAEVIKVERPGSGEWERGLRAVGERLGGQSPFFLAMNRNKKSLTLNLKDPRAREDLRAVNPSIVYVAGTGFGPDGPHADRPGQDLLIQSLSGLAPYGGRRDDPPTLSGSSIADASTALMLAFSAMVGLFHRQRTGEGQGIDVSPLNTAVALQCQELTAFMNLERRFERIEAGIGGAWLSAPFGVYRTADGHLALAMGSLAVLGELLELPELAAYDTPERAWAERDDVYRIIAARLPQRTSGEWLDLLATRDVWCAPVRTFDDVVQDPQVKHSELLATVGVRVVAGDGEVLLRERRGSALVLTVNRPGKLNAISSAVLRELDRRLGEAERDADVRAVVLTGAGPRAFVAADVLLAARRLSAEDALRLGPVAEVVEPERLLEAALAKAEQVAKVAPLATRAMLQLVRTAMEAPLEEGLTQEQDALARLHRSADAAEGIRAFIEKRAPRFTGE